MIFDKNTKRLGIWDIALTKLTVVAGVLFIITMWNPVLTLAQKVNPWIYLAIFVLAAIKPMYQFFKSEDANKVEAKPKAKTTDVATE